MQKGAEPELVMTLEARIVMIEKLRLQSLFDGNIVYGGQELNLVTT